MINKIKILLQSVRQFFLWIIFKFNSSKLGIRFSALDPSKKKLITYSIPILFLVIIFSFLIFKGNYKDGSYIPPEGALAVDIAPDTISEKQELKVVIPSELRTNVKDFSISLEPKVKFTSRVEGDVYYILPDQTLADNSEIAVVVNSNDITYFDYIIWEKLPEILQIYPPNKTLLDPTNSVSIIFNKPVVPLDTVSKQMSLDFTPKITPQVEGVWQWMGTDLLQFVPKKSFELSTEYTISFENDIFKFDDKEVRVSAKFKESTFRVKPIEFVAKTEPASIGSPFVIEYSLPIDAEKTLQGITLTNLTGGTNVPIEVKVKENKISIIPKSNSEGITGFNFGENYNLTVEKVFPKTGNIIVDTETQFSFTLGSLFTESYGKYINNYIPNKNNTIPVVHDNGELHLISNEEISLPSLQYDRNVISSISYGKKCVNYCYGDEENDALTPDYKHLIVRFIPGNLPNENVFKLTFSNIKNRAGVFITRKPFTIEVAKLEKLKLFKPTVISPDELKDGKMRASLGSGGVTICSNNPIRVPEDVLNTWSNYIQFGGGESRVFGWYDSRQSDGFVYEYNCPPNTYVTILDVGLDPNKDYNMNVSVSDIYDQKAISNFVFNSGPIVENDSSINAMQPSSVITQPGDTQLAYSVRNIANLNVSVCEMEVKEYLLSRLNGPDFDAKCKKTYEKVVPGSERNWKLHLVGISVSEITGKDKGLYRIKIGGNGNFVTSWIQISALAVIEKSSEKSSYFVYDSRSLASVPDAKVEITQIKTEGNQELISSLSKIGNTDANGELTANGVPEHDISVVSTRDDITVLMNSSDTLEYAGYEPPPLKTYIYTDRPIYKPGDIVEWKSISRDTKNNALRIPEGEDFKMSLRSEDGTLIEEKDVKVDSYGTASGSFTLPPNARLGGYTIGTDSGAAYIQIESYVKAPFKVDLTSSSNFYKMNESAVISLSADRFEGLPLFGANVEINNISQNNIYQCEAEDSDDTCSYNDRFLSKNNYTVPQNGKLTASFPLSNVFAESDYSGSDKILESVAKVTDSNGRSVSKRVSYSVARSDNNLSINQSQYYGTTERPVTTTFSLNNRESKKGIPNASIEVFIDRITWEYVERQEQDGNFYKKWSQKINPAENKTLITDLSGNASLTWQPLKNGQYRIRVKNGNGARNQDYFYVAGGGGDEIISEPNNNNNLTIKIPKQNVVVGDTIPIIVNTLQSKGLALISVDQANTLNHQIIRFNSNSFVHNLKVDKSFIPNVSVSVTILDDKGNVSQISENLSVNVKEKELFISIKNNKKQYLPGEKAIVSITVKDQNGKVVPNADVSIAVVDQSILALYGNAEKKIVDFFYSYFPNLVTTISNLVNRLHTIDIALGNGAKGGDGGADDLSKKKRGIFKDTAFWIDHVYTDQNGIATTNFTFPDNLTYWQTEAVVSTKDNLFGTARSEVQTSKLISTEPILPRFISYGDTFSIPVQVFNKTNAGADVLLTVSSKELLGERPFTINVNVPPNSTQTQYVPMQAPKDENIKTADVNISVAYKDLADEVSYTLPMHSSSIFEYVATGSYSPNGTSLQRINPNEGNKGEGTITVRAGASSGEYISKGLMSLVQYPFGCVEQKAGTAVALAEIIKLNEDYHAWGDSYKDTVFDGKSKVSTTAALNEGVAYMESQIRESGGYGYYEGLEDNYELTLAVGESLKDIEETGTVSVSKDVLNKIGLYVSNNISTQKFYNDTYKLETVVRGIAYLEHIGYDEYQIDTLKNLAEPILSSEKELEKVSGNTLVSALILSDKKIFDSKIKGMLENEIDSRMSINAREAYISSRSDYYHYDSDLSSTALYLNHIITEKDYENPITYKMLNWLTTHQDDSGLIGSTRDSIRVVRSLINFLEETDSVFQRSTISVYLNSKLIESKKVTGNTLFEPLITTIPESSLVEGRANTIKTTRKGFFGFGKPVFSDITYKYAIPAKDAPSLDRGFKVTREYGDKVADKDGITSAKQGEVIKVRLKISTNKYMNLVGIDDAIPAGFEIINENLETEKSQVAVLDLQKNISNEKKRIYVNYIYPSHTETLDARRFVFVESLTPGEYIYEYYIRARTVGTFSGYPATVSELYSPEVFGRSSGVTMSIKR